MELQKYYYDNRIVRKFLIATVIWGLVGMTVGLLAALQFVFPSLNMDLPWLTFGRIRPLHTNAVIFAFVGNGIYTGVYYSLQRLLKTRMWSDKLSNINFWGWQMIIVSAAITLPLGLTQGKEYAELEWPIDIAIALIWVVFGLNMIMTILNRRTRHLYVAVWFYLATFITVAVLHIVNSLVIPAGLFRSYSVFAGVQDALVQWWYGHNAVAFFLTTPYLGLMYYFVPKAANRPVYSYKLSIIHFWGLIFIYIWAGPHHLLNTALPEWAQALGTVFSIMLIAPSWGGMLNGLLTLRGAWDKVRENPVLKFMVVALTAYGMATFEGPMMSLKSVNAISHYTDWTVGHVHVGGLGWNGMLTFGMAYWLVPKLFRTNLKSIKMANIHFWIATLGIIVYAVPMYAAGLTQYAMWREFGPEGKLVYPEFLETVTELNILYGLRALGGLLFIIGAVIGAINLYKTAKQGNFLAEEEAEAPALEKKNIKIAGEYWHRPIERKPIKLLVFSLVLILIGGAVEIIPTLKVEDNIPKIEAVKPYTPLELAGRDIYIKEGCYNCHSQMIRPFRHEVERYGDYHKPGEFVYDHPFQWGSKRTGPDLGRGGDMTGKTYRDASWHFSHMYMPEIMSPGSIMPNYKWLAEDELDLSTLPSKISVMRTLGVPYPEGYEEQAEADAWKQLEEIRGNIEGTLNNPEYPELDATFQENPKAEVFALIAYLQRVGKDINADKTEK